MDRGPGSEPRRPIEPSRGGARISAVIPAYNEEAHLAECVVEVLRLLAREPEEGEVIVVDDGSTDATWRIVQEMAAEHSAVRGVRFTRNFGKESAIRAGLAYATGDAVVVLDADLQHPPALIPEMVEIWRRRGVRIVEAVKSERQRETPGRGLSSRLYYHLFRWFTGFELAGATDFKLLDREAVDALLALPERNLFFRGLTRWLGYSVERVEFVPSQRGGGAVSRWSLRRLVGLAWGSLTAFSVLPLRLVTLFGLLMLLLAIGLGTQTLLYRMRGLAEPGFPTVILLQLGIGSMVMIGIGLLGEYLGRIYEELKRRPLFVVDRTTASLPGRPERPDPAGERAAEPVSERS